MNHGLRVLSLSLLAASGAALAGCENIDEFMSTSRADTYHGGTVAQNAWVPPEARPRVAVGQFQNKANIEGAAHVGDGLQDTLITELVNSNQFTVLQGGAGLQEVLQEQNLGSAGRMEPGTQAPTGQMEGAQYLIQGALTDFRYDAVGAGFDVRIHRTGVSPEWRQAYARIAFRVIDTRTRRILFASEAVGRSNRVAIGFATGGKNVDFKTGAFYNTPMGIAVKEALRSLVVQLIKNFGAPPQAAPQWQPPGGPPPGGTPPQGWGPPPGQPPETPPQSPPSGWGPPPGGTPPPPATPPADGWGPPPESPPPPPPPTSPPPGWGPPPGP